MADEKKAKSSPKKKEAPAYGIDYVAKALNKEAHLVRAQLRNRKIAKKGRSYGWATKSEADEVVKKLKAADAA